MIQRCRISTIKLMIISMLVFEICIKIEIRYLWGWLNTITKSLRKCNFTMQHKNHKYVCVLCFVFLTLAFSLFQLLYYDFYYFCVPFLRMYGIVFYFISSWEIKSLKYRFLRKFLAFLFSLSIIKFRNKGF